MKQFMPRRWFKLPIDPGPPSSISPRISAPHIRRNRGGARQIRSKATLTGRCSDVLVERVKTDDPESPLNLLNDIYLRRKRSVIATLFEKRPNGQANIFGRAVLTENTPLLRTTTAVNAEQAAAVAPYLQSALVDQISSYVSLRIGGVTCEALLEVVEAPLQLIICGAGFDAVPVVKFAAELGWRVTVCDGRADLAKPQRFQDAQRVVALGSIGELESIQDDDRTACVIMTHSYEQDRSLLSYWLPRKLPYLGILGARSRAQDMLLETGIPFDASNVYAPAGLDIGSESPEEIALSIVAEIQACFRNRRGTPLRDRSGSIHVRESARDSVLAG